MRALMAGLAVLSVVAAGCVADDKKAATPSCESVMPEGFPLSSEGLETGDTLADMEMYDPAGNPVCTRDFAGKVVLINSGAGWCPPCQDETPGIQSVYEEFRGEGFVVIMAMLDDYTNNGTFTNEDFFDEWKDEYDITFLLVKDVGGNVYDYIVDPSDPNYGGIPASVLLTRDQRVSYGHVGFFSESALRTRVNALVGQEATLEY